MNVLNLLDVFNRSISSPLQVIKSAKTLHFRFLLPLFQLFFSYEHMSLVLLKIDLIHQVFPDNAMSLLLRSACFVGVQERIKRIRGTFWFLITCVPRKLKMSKCLNSHLNLTKGYFAPQ
jgi:hypothetical protein